MPGLRTALRHGPTISRRSLVAGMTAGGVMLAAGSGIAEAVQFANKAAGIVVGKLGTAVVQPEELFS